MTYQKFIREKEKIAIENDKEESAVVLLLEHVTKLESNGLYMKMNEEIPDDGGIFPVDSMRIQNQ